MGRSHLSTPLIDFVMSSVTKNQILYVFFILSLTQDDSVVKKSFCKLFGCRYTGPW